jgi:hypothetical protein
MRKLLTFGVVAAALAASPSLAGNASMTNAQGAKVKISCTGGGCKVRQKPKGGKWSTVEKTKGGTDNFNALTAKYKGQGYN